jgi:hypothetical protein
MAKKWFGMKATGGAAVGAAKFTSRVTERAGGFTAKLAKRTAGKK